MLLSYVCVCVCVSVGVALVQGMSFCISMHGTRICKVPT